MQSIHNETDHGTLILTAWAAGQWDKMSVIDRLYPEQKAKLERHGDSSERPERQCSPPRTRRERPWVAVRGWNYWTNKGRLLPAKNEMFNDKGMFAFKSQAPMNNPLYYFDERLWRASTKPEHWPEEVPFPPESMEALTTVAPPSNGKYNDRCVDCSSRDAGCECDLDKWAVKIHHTSEALYQLREIECGVGLFTRKTAHAGKVLAAYVGMVLPLQNQDNSGQRHYDALLMYAGGGDSTAEHDKEARPLALIRAERRGNFTRFINHSCDPNCEMYTMRVGSYYVPVLKTNRAVRKGEQLTVDYGTSFAFDECFCGSEDCRGYLGQWSKEHGAKRKKSHELGTIGQVDQKRKRTDTEMFEKQPEAKLTKTVTVELEREHIGKTVTTDGVASKDERASALAGEGDTVYRSPNHSYRTRSRVGKEKQKNVTFNDTTKVHM